MSDSATPWTEAHQDPPSTNSPGKNIGVGSHSLQGLLHCRQILYYLRHQGSPGGLLLLDKKE